MSSDQMTAEKDSAMKLVVSTIADAKYVEGRRAFFKYRDLGVTDATGGRMRAQVAEVRAGMSGVGVRADVLGATVQVRS